MTDPVVPYLPPVVDARLASWLSERARLTSTEKFKVWVRTGLGLLPSVGPAIIEGYFETLDARHAKKFEETVSYLHLRITELAAVQELSVNREYFATDEFAALLEECLRRIQAEAQQEKLNVIRNALLTVLVDRPSFAFEKKHFFIRSLDGIADTHLHLLQALLTRFGTDSEAETLQTQELWCVVNATVPSEREYVYAAIDLLANRRFIEARTIPQREGGYIDKPLQEFALTSLGAEFLEFIRRNPGPRGSKAAT